MSPVTTSRKPHCCPAARRRIWRGLRPRPVGPIAGARRRAPPRRGSTAGLVVGRNEFGRPPRTLRRHGRAGARIAIRHESAPNQPTWLAASFGTKGSRTASQPAFAPAPSISNSRPIDNFALAAPLPRRRCQRRPSQSLSPPRQKPALQTSWRPPPHRRRAKRRLGIAGRVGTHVTRPPSAVRSPLHSRIQAPPPQKRSKPPSTTRKSFTTALPAMLA